MITYHVALDIFASCGFSIIVQEPKEQLAHTFVLYKNLVITLLNDRIITLYYNMHVIILKVNDNGGSF